MLHDSVFTLYPAGWCLMGVSWGFAMEGGGYLWLRVDRSVNWDLDGNFEKGFAFFRFSSLSGLRIIRSQVTMNFL